MSIFMPSSLSLHYAAVLSRRMACLVLAAFTLGVLALLVRFSTAYAAPPAVHLTHTMRAPIALATTPRGSETPFAQTDIISTIQSVINYVINATVFFPARTFQEAVEKATRNIFSEQLDEFREPLEQVVAVYAFQNGAVFGSLAIPGEVNAIGARLTEAAVPLWVLSLVLLCLAQLTRSAVGLGYGTAEVAGELARWLFIALASGNAVAIVNLVHTGFGALTYAIASQGGSVNPGQFVAAFIPDAGHLDAWPILLLVVGCILGLIIIVTLAVTYIARYTLLLAITGIGPICIAFEGIPFTRFIFRDWLSLFLRLELLQIINITVLVVFQALALGASGSPVAQALMRLAIMIGLASAIIGLNISVFKQVFAVAIDAVVQLRAAAEQMVRLVGMAIGAVVTGGATAPALAGAGATASSTVAGTSAAGGTAALPAMSGDATSNAGGNAALVGASGHAASALARALDGPAGAFLRGYGDGATAGSDYARRRASAARLQEQQQAIETRRTEALAREMGATSADDVETIARSVTRPPRGYSDEQMMRAHRDNAATLRAMAERYGSPARAAAIAGYASFGELAVAMAQERLVEQTTRGEVTPASDAVLPTGERHVASTPSLQTGMTRADATTALPAAPITPADMPTTSPSYEYTSHRHSIADDRISPAVSEPLSPAVPPSQTAPTITAPQASAPLDIPPTNSTPGPALEPTSATPSPPSAPTSLSQPTPIIMNPNLPAATLSMGQPPASDQAPAPAVTPPPPPAPVPAPPVESTPVMPPLPYLPNLISFTADPPSPAASLADWAAQVPPTPIQQWISAPPHIGAPGEQFMLPYDFGMGAMLARATVSSPTHAPLWAEAAYHLRMAYGESYVQHLLRQAQDERMSEQQLMAAVERHVSDMPAARVVPLFWKVDDPPTPNPGGDARGATHAGRGGGDDGNRPSHAGHELDRA